MTNLWPFVEPNCHCLLEQRRLQLQKRAQQFIRMDNVAAAFAMGVNDPTPTLLCDGAAITPRPASSAELVSDDFPVLHVATRFQAKSLYER